MNQKTKVMIALWIIPTIILAWSATIPNPYIAPFNEMRDVTEYYWQYPAFFCVVGAIAFLVNRPWKDTHSYVGAGISFAIFLSLAIFMEFTAMHIPMAHAVFLLASLILSQMSLFYCGFAFSKRGDKKKARANAT